MSARYVLGVQDAPLEASGAWDSTAQHQSSSLLQPLHLSRICDRAAAHVEAAVVALPPRLPRTEPFLTRLTADCLPAAGQGAAAPKESSEANSRAAKLPGPRRRRRSAVSQPHRRRRLGVAAAPPPPRPPAAPKPWRRSTWRPWTAWRTWRGRRAGATAARPACMAASCSPMPPAPRLLLWT